VSQEAKQRLGILCSSNDGFRIAEKDLELRGPGDIEGTRQSGALNFKLANIVTDRLLLEQAKTDASRLLDLDPDFENIENQPLNNWLRQKQGKTQWSKIS
jgi:ATP-dependent DNA helicase RecG